MTDIVAGMAPPFDNFFVEFQGVPNKANVHAWGVSVEAHDYAESFGSFEDDVGTPRWILKLKTFLERTKGKPFGPVSSHTAGLAEDGTWFRHSNGLPWWNGAPVGFQGGDFMPWAVKKGVGDGMAQMLFPVLLAISFMHCKNVKMRDCIPPKKLSLSHQKKHGRELIRYHVLDIKPLRKLLDRYRSGSRADLRHALHICRGHFKTFTEDAPLLGRHSGTFWWTPQVRGARDVGVVVKDYRVKTPAAFGTVYREANAAAPAHQKQATAATIRIE